MFNIREICKKYFLWCSFFDYFNQIFNDELGFLVIARVIYFLQRILFCTFWCLQGLSKWCLNHFCVGLLIRWWRWMTISFRLSIVKSNLFRKECDSRALNDRKYALYKRNGYRPKPREKNPVVLWYSKLVLRSNISFNGAIYRICSERIMLHGGTKTELLTYRSFLDRFPFYREIRQVFIRSPEWQKLIIVTFKGAQFRKERKIQLKKVVYFPTPNVIFEKKSFPRIRFLRDFNLFCEIFDTFLKS